MLRNEKDGKEKENKDKRRMMRILAIYINVINWFHCVM
jgi:hypothetical protein